MYELIKLAYNCYYIDSPAKIGVVKLDGNNVCLIDSGSDKEAGRKIKKILDENGWKLNAIYNTHAHADHIGGNKYLQNQTGCKIFVPSINQAFAKYPILEPAFLYGGYPFKELRNKFLMAQESDAEVLNVESLPEQLSLIDLPGHFFDMVGFKTSCGVVFLGDCLLSESILDKYKIPFIFDIDAYIKTLEKIKAMNGVFVPAHAEVTNNVIAIVEYNLNAVEKLINDVANIAKGLCFEDILQKLFNEYNLNLDYNQYVLAGCTIRSVLSCLKDGGRIGVSFKDNKLLWG